MDTVLGLDYVSHDDVVPYTKTSKEPFGNVLLSHFLIPPNGETQGQSTNYIGSSIKGQINGSVNC